MSLGICSAAFAYMGLAVRSKAEETCSLGIDFNPTFPSTWTARGVITFPAESATADFREAVRLGSDNYTPYYYLAHDALVKGEYSDAQEWCEKTLSHRPDPKTRAFVLAWLAICRFELGYRQEAIRDLFEDASVLDPGNPGITRTFRDFQHGERPHWEQMKTGEFIQKNESFVAEEQSQFFNNRGDFDLAGRELAIK